MKFLRLSLCLLLVCVLSFGAFSISVSAEQLSDVSISQVIDYYFLGEYEDGYVVDYPTDSREYYDFGDVILDENSYLENKYVISYADSKVIIPAERSFEVTISNIYTSIRCTQVSSGYRLMREYDQLYVALVDSRGDYYYEGEIDYFYNSNTKDCYFKVTGTATEDIVKIIIVGQYNPTKQLGAYGTGTMSVVYNDSSQNPTPIVDVSTKEEGLLTNIWGSLTSGFDSLTSGLSNLANGIKDLPSKIWNFIENGLVRLFVPDEDFFVEYSDSWKNLLSARFGAIYQAGTMITDLGSRITMADETNTIFMPAVSLSSVGIPFEFGGYDVQVVPTGFEWITDPIKLIISVSCTFLFINGLRKRYDEVMGVEK